MIQLEHVYKNYPTKKGQEIEALNDINLQVQTGEIFGVIGTSGAGKSTLIRCVNLLEKPSQGKVFVDHQELTALSPKALRQARQKIGMIFQQFNLLSSRTVYQNIALPLEFLGKNKNEIAKIVIPALELVGLDDKKNVYPSQLSGGQKQRVAIARALVNNSKLLLCDEATSSLDPQTTDSILQLLKDINEKFAITILLITHEMRVVKEICHRLAVLQQGRIVEQNEVLKFFAEPKTPFAKAFIRTEFKQHLPSSLQQNIIAQKSHDTLPLLQISFFGEAANEAVISQLIQKFQININILQANIEHIREQMVGTMIVEMDTNEEITAACMSYLIEKDIQVEIIGYVKRNANTLS